MKECMTFNVNEENLTIIFSQESASRERIAISIVNGSQPLSYAVFKNIRRDETGIVKFDECFHTSVIHSALEKGALWLAGVHLN